VVTPSPFFGNTFFIFKIIMGIACMPCEPSFCYHVHCAGPDPIGQPGLPPLAPKVLGALGLLQSEANAVQCIW